MGTFRVSLSRVLGSRDRHSRGRYSHNSVDVGRVRRRVSARLYCGRFGDHRCCALASQSQAGGSCGWRAVCCSGHHFDGDRHAGPSPAIARIGTTWAHRVDPSNRIAVSCITDVGGGSWRMAHCRLAGNCLFDVDLLAPAGRYRCRGYLHRSHRPKAVGTNSGSAPPRSHGYRGISRRTRYGGNTRGGGRDCSPGGVGLALGHIEARKLRQLHGSRDPGVGERLGWGWSPCCDRGSSQLSWCISPDPGLTTP